MFVELVAGGRSSYRFGFEFFSVGVNLVSFRVMVVCLEVEVN